MSAELSQANLLRPNKTLTLDLAKILSLKTNVRDLANGADSLKNFPFPEIGLRITFRDSQTGEKYACYKVLSTLIGLPEPWGDEVSMSGIGQRLWTEDIYSEVMNDMRQHFDDGATEMHCDH